MMNEQKKKEVAEAAVEIMSAVTTKEQAAYVTGFMNGAAAILQNAGKPECEEKPE